MNTNSPDHEPVRLDPKVEELTAERDAAIATHKAYLHATCESLSKIEGRLETLRARMGELHKVHEWQRTRIAELESLLDCRAGRLLCKGATFLVVKNDEPYFRTVYAMIRAREIEIERWSEEDETRYRNLTAGESNEILL
jgi:hypothetical protein